MFRTLAALAFVACATAQDPPQGWLGYATGTNPSGGVITHMEAKWKVLDNPKESGCFYSPWFGIETSDNLNLFQPVNPYVGSGWEFYIEYFQWRPTHNENSHNYRIQPGDILHGVVKFDNASQEYTATHTNLNNGNTITKTIGVQKDERGEYKKYTIIYIVFEKTCRSCAQYPPNNKVTFYDIKAEYDNRPVSPHWTTSYVDNRCNNRAHIINETTVEITWEA